MLEATITIANPREGWTNAHNEIDTAINYLELDAGSEPAEGWTGADQAALAWLKKLRQHRRDYDALLAGYPR